MYLWADVVAEELIFDDITTGASQDIKTATETARAMVTEYGMSDAVGLINYTSGSDDGVHRQRYRPFQAIW